MTALTDQLAEGLNSPICLTWEWTYACDLACVHCLSSSGRRDPNELSTEQMKAVVDQLAEMQVFYVNIGGGEPMLRPDFFEIVEYCVEKGVGVKFSTNGGRINAENAKRLASMDYVDIQISLDGVDAITNDAVRGEGTYERVRTAMDHLRDADFGQFKLSVVMTRENVEQVDAYEALANEYHWLLARPQVLTGDSFFHLSALGEPLPGLNLCGAGRVVCLIDPVGDVFACPFVLHDEFKAGSIHGEGGFRAVWQTSDLFTSLREPSNPGACGSCGSFDACGGGCMATKFFTGLPLDAPDPECVFGHGETALAELEANGGAIRPTVSVDHSKPVGVGKKRIPVSIL
ncbi:MAG: mycofactocin radical SAM maturase [Actinobacteria bacterium]|nr:mycofactocin radical SAM maturase [Actinomycetota bacterium]